MSVEFTGEADKWILNHVGPLSCPNVSCSGFYALSLVFFTQIGPRAVVRLFLFFENLGVFLRLLKTGRAHSVLSVEVNLEGCVSFSPEQRPRRESENPFPPKTASGKVGRTMCLVKTFMLRQPDHPV